ncbi:MAG: hypothetical protein QM754_05295 [Tepidisphaeraceae bacterium]
MNRGVRSRRPGSAALQVLLVGILAVGTIAHAKSGSRPGTKGTYAVKFHGSFAGEASAKVNPDHVALSGDLHDANGATVTLDAKKLKLDDSRFSGTGTVNGQSVDITGRVDAAEGGVLKIARIVITVNGDNGQFARAIGEIASSDE